jgi:hypothetical protein
MSDFPRFLLYNLIVGAESERYHVMKLLIVCNFILNPCNSEWISGLFLPPFQINPNKSRTFMWSMKYVEDVDMIS